jgi:hypothetical protein
MNDKMQTMQIQIELPAEVADGTYANYTVISTSNSEFVIDFIRLVPGAPKNKVKARIIMTPQSIKNLQHAIESSVKKFEETFGEIKIDPANSKREIGFQGSKND